MTNGNSAMTNNSAWLDRLRLELAFTGLDARQADAAVEECAEHLRESGEHAPEAFGDAKRYAVQLGRTRVSESKRASLGLDGLRTGNEWGELVLFSVGIGLVVVATWSAIVTGMTAPLTVATVVGTACFAATWMLLALARDARNAGCLGRFRLLLGLSAVGLLGTGNAFLSLPHTRIGSMPTWAIGVAGVMAIVASFQLDSRKARPAAEQPPWTRGAARHDATDLSEREGPDDEEILDDAAWLRRLSGLLQGRHDWQAGPAREAVAQVEDHLAETGRPAHEEYGPADVYALRLVESEPDRSGRADRGFRYELSMGTIFGGIGIAHLFQGETTWLTYALLVLGAVHFLLAGWRWHTRGEGSPGVSSGTGSQR